jgi:hypothetical protein
VQRIFDLYDFKFDYTKVKEILNNKEGIYYQFLRAPFINIFNNIIISQIEGYREYIQKLFIDYLLSGSANEQEAPVQGETIRQELEENRNQFMQLAEEFDLEVFNHNSLIAESQIALIELAKTKFKESSEPSKNNQQKLLDLVADFEKRGRELTLKFRDYRRKFRDIIIVNQDLLELLPNYYLDIKQVEAYKNSIDFDTNIGEDGF